MSWLWGATTNPQYEELVEKACSPLNLPYPQSEDISVSLEISDVIRSKAVQPKAAMQSLKRRVASKNGRVQMYALGLTDTCIKNGGDHFLAEIASKEFVDELSGLIRSSLTNAEVKQMALRMFQSWALAFQSKPELSFFTDVYTELKNSGESFPPPPSHTSQHLLDTTTAPTWVDSDVCMRCRTAFTFTNRKHHCRNCGLVYDQACSSRTMPLPRFGIAEEVRVCEGCWMKSGKGKTANGPPPEVPGRTPRIREDLDADLQRAIEMSLAESQPGGKHFVGSEPPIARTGTKEDDDEDLRLAIEASLREMEKARPSAPQGADEPELKPLPTFDLSAREAETILTFSNTMDQMAAYGERDLRRFPHAHVLAEQAYALGGKLQRNAEEKTTKQQMLAEMQNKLSQAVSLYGQILDGQQAYSARKMQEQQQRQYAQHPAYAYAPPTQHYDNPQMNGHAAPDASYAPPQPQAVYERPRQVKAGPSLYPTMPTYAAPPDQNLSYRSPQQYHPRATSPIQQPYMPTQNATQWAASPPPEQPSMQRHSSMRVPQVTAQPFVPVRQASATYGDVPQISQPQMGYTAEVSAPPPVDLASHPGSSPTSVKSALPAQHTANNHTSPIPVNHVPLSSSPQPQQPQQLATQSFASSWQQQTPPQHTQPRTQPQLQVQQNNSQPYSAQPQHVYDAASFPQAPAAVFPDAPSMDPQGGLEKQEREEALLIEL